ncbi:I78 family peptidase inhibitor [Streptomyces mashuensis]|nr:I78 family peptidase inhibitor [Streptomyces mashuensis]
MAPLPHLPSDPDDDLEAYVGLAEPEAVHRARSRGWTDVRSLPPHTIVTLEYRAGRLNFEVDGGVVRRCWKG